MSNHKRRFIRIPFKSMAKMTVNDISYNAEEVKKSQRG